MMMKVLQIHMGHVLFAEMGKKIVLTMTKSPVMATALTNWQILF